MHRPPARRIARAVAMRGIPVVPLALGLAALLLPALPACSRTVDAAYPGNNTVQYPWRACGMICEGAFTELEATHDPNGKDCEELVAKAEGSGGTDDRVTAAALYDSALLLILRGKGDEAGSRFAKAEALDPDPQYKELEAKYREAQRYLAIAPGPAIASVPAGSAPVLPVVPSTPPAPSHTAAAPPTPSASGPSLAPAASATPVTSGALTSPR